VRWSSPAMDTLQAELKNATNLCAEIKADLASDPRSFFDKADADKSRDISAEEWIEVCKLDVPQSTARLESLFEEIARGHKQISLDRLTDFAEATNLIRSFVQESKCSEVIAEILARWLVSRRPMTGEYGTKEAEQLLAGVRAQDAADTVAKASKALAALSQGAADVKKALAHRSQDAGMELGSKYAGPRRRTAGVQRFRRASNILGVPHPQIFEAMKEELVDEGKGAGKTFEAWNSGRNVTTTGKEWRFVAEPFDPSTVKAEVDPGGMEAKARQLRRQPYAHTPRSDCARILRKGQGC
jgi:hypothetical protein